jgi:RND superfamily putative drug exporter
MTDPFARLGYTMARFRWVVIGIWVAVIAAGALIAPKTASSLSGGGFILPGSESDQADVILRDEFNASTASNALIVFETGDRTVDDPEVAAEITAALERVATVELVESVISFYSTGDASLVSTDRKTTVAVVSLTGDEGENQDAVAELREQLEGLSVEHNITGTPAINHDIQVVSEEDLRRAEMFTIPIVLVLLLLVFRTIVAAAIPLALGAGSVIVTLAIIYFVAQQTDVSVFALNVASMIGLGLGVDFSLIVVSRYREELASGKSVNDAVAMTMATSGRSISYSAITVFLGMLVLTVLFGLMIVRSVSLGVMLVAFAALLAGLTLLPASLAALGHRINSLRVIPERKTAAPTESGIWYRLSHAIMRRPWIWLMVSLGILVAIAIPVKDISLYGTTTKILPDDVESAAGVNALSDAFGANRLTPIQVVIQTGEPNGAWQPEFLTALAELTAQIQADPTVAEVQSLAVLVPGITPEEFAQLQPSDFTSDPQKAAAAARFVNIQGDNSIEVVTIFSKYEQYDERHEQFVYDLRDEIIPGVRQLQIYDVDVGGDAARLLDFKDFLYGRFPYLVLGVMALTFIILMMFFQSLFLPVKAILMNLASILATYGALVLVFQEGWGAQLIGLDPIGRINVMTPAILFAVLFGLSTDYEVFMLSRVKEYYRETGDNEESVATGLEHTAGVITAAGLILIGTFGSFAIADVVTVKEIGLGLAIGALIDSTVVRVIMVPATMKLAGGANWYMPEWLKKIVPEISEGPAPAPAPVPVPAPAMAVAGGASMPSALEAPASQAPSGAPPGISTARWGGRPLVARLRSTGGSVGADTIVLNPTVPFRIGRDPTSELQLFDVRISRHHARIDYHDGNYIMTDLQSTNGVSINHMRILVPTVLRHGDKIEIGNMGTVLFDFELQPASEPARV